jgi:hypothetical protein
MSGRFAPTRPTVSKGTRTLTRFLDVLIGWVENLAVTLCARRDSGGTYSPMITTTVVIKRDQTFYPDDYYHYGSVASPCSRCHWPW